MKAERFFLLYAFPCADILLKRGEIDKNEYDKLKGMINTEIDSAFLEKVFWRAVKPLNKLANQIEKSIWSMPVQKKYWYEIHNKLINEQEENFKHLSYEQYKLCRIYPAKLLSGGLVEYKEGKRKVRLDFVDAGEGDMVTIHYDYAVEKINQKIADRILRSI